LRRARSAPHVDIRPYALAGAATTAPRGMRGLPLPDASLAERVRAMIPPEIGDVRQQGRAAMAKRRWGKTHVERRCLKR
jgi:hypothetical protein